ncbi:MAG: cofactor-independent phosphoglycerate mutase [Victivallaceae bacterium]|nr:cofactor-independent phosphoglycerate mutase [Victivallaceae bacterium]
MSKALIFLADGMADRPLKELNGKTPLEAVPTPAMDEIAKRGASGSFLTLPDGLPTSSDVANMSVMGFMPEHNYPGRGPIEAASQGIDLIEHDIAWRCNLVTVGTNGILDDYSAGHIDETNARCLMDYLEVELGNKQLTFHCGVSYRNLLVLHGEEFSAEIDYYKPDSSQGQHVDDLRLSPRTAGDKKAEYTIGFLEELGRKATTLLMAHPLNSGNASPANWIWPWSPGGKATIEQFSTLYNGKCGAIISAVDVIHGIGICSGMKIIKVPGATGFIDTNYEGKAQAAIKALEEYDFVYLHVEAIDECSHMGDLKLKMQAIADFDSRIVAPVMAALEGQDINFAIMPDHPVPIELREHTTEPVPVAICGPAIVPDAVQSYGEHVSLEGTLGLMKGRQLMDIMLELV